MKKMPHAQRDFTADMLPSTRRQAFADGVKLRYGKLVLVGLILFAFSLPLFAVAILRDAGTAAVYAEYEAGAIDLSRAQSLVFWTNNFYGLVDILGYALFSAGLAGCLSVVKRIGWIEPLFFGSDFREGMKDNWLRYAVTGGILGLFLYLAETSLNGAENFFLSVLPFGVLFVVFLPVALLVLTQSCVYRLKFSESVKNALSLYFRTAPKTLLAAAVVVLPALLALIGNLLLKYLLMALAAVFLAPLGLLGWFLYSCYLFDGAINKEHFPELYQRGLVTDKEKSIWRK